MPTFATPHDRPTGLLTALLAAALICATPLPGAHAATVRYYDAASVPNPDVVASILGGSQPGQRMKMRGGPHIDEPAAQAPLAADGGRDLNDAPALNEQALSIAAHAAVLGFNARYAAAAPSPRAHAAAAERPSALAVAVNFDNDSARIQASAAPTLDAVAEGLRRAGFARPVVIEGHTSATGAIAHNLRLSLARARSVKRYLVQHGIPAAALRTVGMGPRVPLNTADPAAPENRRVQFRSA